jgi:hypothetical protein
MSDKNKRPARVPDQSAKIHGDVLQMARTVVSVEGGSVTKLLSEICRPVLEKRVKQLIDSGALIPARPRDE